MTEYVFVLDGNGKKLSPTNKGHAYSLVRKGKARWINFYSLTIQLFRIVNASEIDKSIFVLGIDDRSKEVGLAIVQHCKTKDKVIFKAHSEV